MKISKFINKRRKDRGLSDIDFANVIGISVDSASDLEFIEDQIRWLSIPQFKRMCEALQLTPLDVFRVASMDVRDLNLSATVRKRREEKEWSIDDLSDHTGYESSLIESIEKGEDLDNLCIDVLKKLAMELDLSLETLLEKL